ncbi:MAG: inositol monophosphatase family protein [Robiginitomaculum sp.]
MTSQISKTNKDIAARLTLARAMADHARTITTALFNEGMTIENKASGADFDPVTNADKMAELALRKMISAAFPNDAIIGEEFDDVAGSSDFLWTLDPIDGTRAFVAGVPVWSTLIAVSHKDKPVIGIIDLPALGPSGQRFIGGPDGAFREDHNGSAKINSRPCKRIKDIVLGCTEPLSMFTQGERASYEMIRRTARFSRLGLDAFGYALVASGKMDMIIEASLKPCDVRALIPIIEGAGGALTNWHGGSAINGGRVVAAGDIDVLNQVYPYLQRALDTKIQPRLSPPFK